MHAAARTPSSVSAARLSVVIRPSASVEMTPAVMLASRISR